MISSRIRIFKYWFWICYVQPTSSRCLHRRCYHHHEKLMPPPIPAPSLEPGKPKPTSSPWQWVIPEAAKESIMDLPGYTKPPLVSTSFTSHWIPAIVKNLIRKMSHRSTVPLTYTHSDTQHPLFTINYHLKVLQGKSSSATTSWWQVCVQGWSLNLGTEGWGNQG